MAEVIAQNNDASRRYYWEMRDTIDFLSGALSAASDPKYGNDKQSSIATTRSIRALDMKRSKAPQEKITPTELRDRWEALGVTQLSNREIVGLMVALLDEPKRPVGWDVAVRLFESYRQEAKKAEKAEERVTAARKALGGF